MKLIIDGFKNQKQIEDYINWYRLSLKSVNWDVQKDDDIIAEFKRINKSEEDTSSGYQ